MTSYRSGSVDCTFPARPYQEHVAHYLLDIIYWTLHLGRKP